MKNKENKKIKTSKISKKHISLKNKKRYVSFMMIVSLTAIFMFCIFYIAGPYLEKEMFDYGDTIKDNVYIDDELVSGMTFKELEKHLDKRIRKIKNQEYELMREDLQQEYLLKDLDLDFNNKQIINQIKRRNLFSLIVFKRNYHLTYLNNYKVKELYHLIESEFESNPKNGKFVRDENMNITYDNYKYGYSLKNADLEPVIDSIINNETLIYIPGKQLKPVDYNYIGISKKISTVTLMCDNNTNALTNVTTALEKLNGHVIEINSDLDLNDVIGPINEQNGYVFYYKNVGYGIDRVSSMIYYDSLLAGLDIIERYSLINFPYFIDPGYDASIENGNLVIHNNTLNPIYISTYIKGDKITIEFWSKPSNLKYRVVSEHGTDLSYNIYRETYEDGRFINRELINNTVYESY